MWLCHENEGETLIFATTADLSVGMGHGPGCGSQQVLGGSKLAADHFCSKPTVLLLFV